MVSFYFLAGVNHFVNPGFYLPLIPDYFPEKELLNQIVGIAEIMGAIGLVVSTTQKFAAWGLIVMLIAFIPSHLYFIEIGSCVEDGLCVPEWVAWFRLIVIHPLLIYWAWIYTKSKNYG